MAGKKRKATKNGGSAVKKAKKTKTVRPDEGLIDDSTTRSLAPDPARGSACDAVVNTTELLEQILLGLPMITLYGIRRVCHRFYDVMQSSTALQKRMWLQMEDLRELDWTMPRPHLAGGPRRFIDEDTAQNSDSIRLAQKFMPAKLNPLLAEWGDSWQTFYSHGTSCGLAFSLDVRARGSWRDLPLAQPACKVAVGELRCNALRAEGVSPCVTVESATGLTLGDVIDEMLKCPNHFRRSARLQQKHTRPYDVDPRVVCINLQHIVIPTHLELSMMGVDMTVLNAGPTLAKEP